MEHTEKILDISSLTYNSPWEIPEPRKQSLNPPGGGLPVCAFHLLIEPDWNAVYAPHVVWVPRASRLNQNILPEKTPVEQTASAAN